MTDDQFNHLIRRGASADHRAAVRDAVWRRIFGEPEQTPPSTTAGDADGGKGEPEAVLPTEHAGDEYGTPFTPIDLDTL
jgi:hypothetical protein